MTERERELEDELERARELAVYLESALHDALAELADVRDELRAIRRRAALQVVR